MWLPVNWFLADMHGKERLKDKIAALVKVLKELVESSHKFV